MILMFLFLTLNILNTRKCLPITINLNQALLREIAVAFIAYHAGQKIFFIKHVMTSKQYRWIKTDLKTLVENNLEAI